MAYPEGLEPPTPWSVDTSEGFYGNVKLAVTSCLI